MGRRIAMIGAGSIGFTRRLMQDILSVPELGDTTFALCDISEQNLEMVAALCRRDVAYNQLPARIEATTDQRRAIAGADYVICTIRQGGLAAFQHDIDIPLRYGIDQCVGDTICAGGIMYGQRSIPAMLAICADMRREAPGARLLNYSNPMAMNVWACEQFGGIATIGLCHGVQGAHQQIASVIEHWARRSGQIAADERVTTDDVTVSAAGINHQTWFIQVRWRDQDMIPLLGELFAAHPTYPTTEKVRIDVLRRFGYYSTESNGHLSEYLPWYRKRAADIPRWIDLSNWIHGETGGYLRVCSESRRWFETDYPNWLREQPPRFDPATRSHEHGSYIIEALETGRVYRGHFNVINRGHITNLPDGCVIEIPGYVDRSGVQLPVIGRLPLACAATCAASVRVQELAVEAAAHGDVQLLKQAMLHDPLVGAVCDPEEVWQMTDELLVAQAAWLPQYADALAGAAARLTQATADGTRVALREGAGAARLTTRSAEQLAADAARTRRLAGSPDRGRVAE